MAKLTNREVETLKKPGRHADRNGLYLDIRENGRKSWVLRYQKHGRRHTMGLGSYPVVTLAKARELTLAAHRVLADGGDPISTRKANIAKARAPAPTFGQFADEWFLDNKAMFTSDKHRHQWQHSILFDMARLRPMPLDAITTEHVLNVLKPIWARTPETAKRLQGRTERILAAAKAVGHREGDNPAQWRGHLATMLPARDKDTRKHFDAMPYRAVPAFIARLREHQSVSARALEVTILLVTRTSETLKMRWSELDLEAKLWVIPKERMKSRSVAHRVPLSDRVFEIINSQPRIGEYVFPGRKLTNPLSETTMLVYMRRMGVGKGIGTVHGFRSSFRDWAADQAQFSHTTAEHALAHRISDKAEAAYRRGDELEKRRMLMETWAAYCGSLANAGVNVIPLSQRKT